MKEQVTVIPADQIIIVDGEALQFTFSALASVHAVQWHGQAGHVEYNDGSVNLKLTHEDYATQVHPFVQLWEVEKARLQEELNQPLPLEVLQEQAYTQLKAKRLEQEYLGPLIVVGGDTIRFPSEVKDETRLNSLAALFMENPDLEIPDWKVADGVYATMTTALLKQVKYEGFLHIQRTFSIERAKRDEIAACTSAEAIYNWMHAHLHEGWG